MSFLTPWPRVAAAWLVLLTPAFLVALACVFAGQFLPTRTVFGRYCVAIGTNFPRSPPA